MLESFVRTLSQNREFRRENSLMKTSCVAFARQSARSKSSLNVSICLSIGLFVATLGVEPVHGQVFQDGQGAIEMTDEMPENLIQPKRRGKSKSNFKPRVGRQAAAKYMSPQRPDQKDEGGGDDEQDEVNRSRQPAGTSSDRYLALHAGWFVSDNSYKWGAPESQSNIGRWNVGVTYRLGEWINSMDLVMRFDVSHFALAEGGVTKFSFLPLITFPDASSRFPLYFGAGAGIGFFGTQLAGESSLALDYQLLAGARFFNVWDLTGLFIEGGIKNHLHLISDGQYNGTFITTGLLFTF